MSTSYRARVQNHMSRGFPEPAADLVVAGLDLTSLEDVRVITRAVEQFQLPLGECRPFDAAPNPATGRSGAKIAGVS